ncbi:Glycerophosphoryl diester phosphodiesterase family-domain-containing protein [Xylariaceae sp. FL0255]|nr:Glycerophosphoryl diester phosphodiesterase family-domain-containing protein [Xylariaceae sp. FL0255]
MKFGLDYHRYIIPEWSEYYIPYNALKFLLKHRPAEIEDTISLFIRNIQNSGAFLNVQLSLIDERAKPVQNDLSLINSSANPDSCHIAFLSGILSELRRDLLKLQSFIRVNEEAGDRLLARLQIAAKAYQLGPVKSHWRLFQEGWKPRVGLLRTELSDTIQAITTSRNSEEIYDLSPPLPINSKSSLILDKEFGSSPNHALIKELAFTLCISSSERSIVPSDHLKQLIDILQPLTLSSVSALFKFFALHRSWEPLLRVLEHSVPLGCVAFRHTDMIFLAEVLHSKIEHDGVENAKGEPPHWGSEEEPVLEIFRLMRSLGATASQELWEKDANDQVLLHHLTRYGYVPWCQVVLKMMLEEPETPDFIPTILTCDGLGLTPLHYAIIADHGISIIELFVDSLSTIGDKVNTPDYQHLLIRCLYLAIMSESDEKIAKLLRITTDLGHELHNGNTVLHLASQKGHGNIVARLIKAGANVNMVAKPRGWTPIFEAAARGHTDVVQLLLEAGADVKLTDEAGWTPKEVATYRGRLAVTGLLDPLDDGQHVPSLLGCHRTTPRIDCDATEGGVSVIVHLGPMQLGRNTPWLRLCHLSGDYDPGSQEGASFVLCIFGDSSHYRIKLPIMDDPHDCPLIFPSTKDGDMHLTFKIFEVVDSKNETLICGGTSVLECNKLLFGAQRQSLIREHTVSIVDAATLDMAGSIIFTYLIARPFPHLKSPIYNLKDAVSKGMMVVGHRGSGQNVSSREHLQIGENTIESFRSAADGGASFVEDAQLTRDLEPVIYHNFSLSESGTDIPIYDLTLDQFRHTSSSQQPRKVIRPRSRSLDVSEDPYLLHMSDRLANTTYFKSNGFISNTRGTFIQEPLATLKELFHKLPEHIGFNIELKYQRLHEAKNANVAPVALDLNVYVDTILEHVHQSAGKRPIILSSFTPEVCILLSLKQKAYPVMLITNAGKLPSIDLERRAASLQAALRFARLWSLTGLVLACEPFISCPRFVKFVKQSGLVCASYGLRNSVPDDVRIQASAGLDIIIVDRVRAVVKTLEEMNP